MSAAEPPTLGEILGACLMRNLEDERREREQRTAAQANYLAACHLSRELSPVFRIDEGCVFNALTWVPDNMLGLLHSPEGWSALAEFVAAELGAPSPSYRPTRH